MKERLVIQHPGCSFLLSSYIGYILDIGGFTVVYDSKTDTSSLYIDGGLFRLETAFLLASSIKYSNPQLKLDVWMQGEES